MAPSLEGFSAEKVYEGTLLSEQKGYEGHPPELKIKVVMSKVVFKGLPTQPEKKVSKRIPGASHCRDPNQE